MKQILTTLLVALVLISGCSKGTIEAQPISEATAEVVLEANVTENPCEKIICGANSHCDNGKCVCDDNYKTCNDKCVPKDSCCMDTDCAIGKICKDGSCVDMNCGYYQKYDYAKKSCVCSESAKWCGLQNKCIPKGNCCQHTECGSGEACIQTQFVGIVCIQKDKKMCRSLPENRRESYVFATDERYSVVLKSVLQTGKINLTVNDKNILIAKQEIYNLGGNTTLFVEELKTMGGDCREK